MTERRGLAELFRRSFRLFKSAGPEIAVIVGLGLLPDAALTTLALGVSGLTNSETLAQVMAGEHLGRLGLVAAARAAGQAAAFVATLALMLALDARDRQTPLGVKRAFAQATAGLWPYFSTMARVFLYVAVGLILFIAPGVLLAILYFFAAAAVVVDGLSGPHALAKSRELVAHQPVRVVVYLVAAIGACVIAGGALVWALDQALGWLSLSMGLAGWQTVNYLHRCVVGMTGAWVAAFMILFYKDLSANASSA